MTVVAAFDAMSERYSRFSVSCKEEGSPPLKILLTISDSLDNETSIPFIKEVERMFDAAPTLQFLALDASGIRYMSSTGIGALGSIYMAATKRNIEFQLINPSSHVTLLLKLLGFETFLPITRTGGAS